MQGIQENELNSLPIEEKWTKWESMFEFQKLVIKKQSE